MTPHQQLAELKAKLKAECDAVRDKYEEMIRKEVHAIDCDYREQRQALERQCREIDKQAELDRIAAATTKTLGGVPVGGKVVEWKSKYRFSTTYVPSGTVGIVDVCTHDSKFAINVGKYSQPTIGSLFIRILKKDGTPSLKFAGGFTLDGNLPWMWHPEGVDPNYR